MGAWRTGVEPLAGYTGCTMTEPETQQGEATQLLRAFHPAPGGSAPEGERLWEIVYDTLRGLAATLLSSERADHTLQPTALANEAYLKLIAQQGVSWQDRAHFMAIAAQAMRRILVDHARAQQRAKRGGGWERVELDSDLEVESGMRLDVVAVNEALERLREVSGRQARIVELRFFAGLSMEEVAEVVGAPLRTLEREWRFGKAWLARALEAHEGGAR